MAFLATEVINRQSRGQKRKRAEESDDDEPNIIGKPSVISYVTALTALWSEQASHGINHHPNPRADPAVMALVQSVPRRENERRYEEYHDRGEGTMDSASPSSPVP